jgi:signal peptidase II
LGGAVGNLLDRVRFGYVVDFVDLHFWPVFNLADSGITIGSVLIAFQILVRGDIRQPGRESR